MKSVWHQRRSVQIVAGIALVLGVVELGARLMWSREDVLYNPALGFLEDHATLFWTLKPSSTSLLPSGVTITTNALGLRSPEIEKSKPEGVTRVLVLGESGAFGETVRDEQLFPRLMETRLNELTKGKRRWEVVNAAAPRYSTWQSYIYLEERGIYLEPDLVLVYQQAVDFMPLPVADKDHFLYSMEKTDRQLYQERREFTIFKRLTWNSRVLMALRHWWRMRPVESPPEKGDGAAEEGPTSRVPQKDRHMALARMGVLCMMNRVPMVIVAPVYRQPVFEDGLLKAFADEQQLMFIDLPYLRYTTPWPDEPPLFADALNPTAEGHRRIAMGIVERLQDAGMVDGPLPVVSP